MRLLTYSVNDQPLRLGIWVDENTIIDPQLAYIEQLKSDGQQRVQEIASALLPHNPIEFIANGEIALKTAKEAITFALENKNHYKFVSPK